MRNLMENMAKVRVSLPELDLGLKLPEQHTLLWQRSKGASHMCKGTQHPLKGIIYATVTIYYIFILSSYSDSKKENYVVSCCPLKMNILITEIQ